MFIYTFGTANVYKTAIGLELRTRLAPYIHPKAESNMLIQSANNDHTQLYNAFGLEAPKENKEFNFRELMGLLRAKGE